MIPHDNALLRCLPDDSLERLVPNLRAVALHSGQVLQKAGAAVRCGYFPVTGIVSLMAVDADATSADGAGASVGLTSVGCEGVTGVPGILSNTASSYQVVASVAGTGWMLAGAAFRAEFSLGGAFQAAVLADVNAQTCQVNQTNLCNLHHTPEGRLCHVLLLLSDRLGALEFEATLPARTGLLGVLHIARSDAFEVLRAEGLVDASGDRVIILHRAGLEQRACACYHRLHSLRARSRSLVLHTRLEIARAHQIRASRARLWSERN